MKSIQRSGGLRALIGRRLRAFFREDRGQVLPISAIMLVGFLGMAAVSVDMGHAVLNYEQLQNAADAAAMAGAQSLPNTTASTVATQYSAVANQYNAQTMTSGTTMSSGYPKLLCLTTLKSQGMACSSPANANAVQVRLQMSSQMAFAGMSKFGYPSMTIAATSTAAMRGASASPYNVAIILDETLSMASYDSDCGATQLACALNGIQVLLKSLTPCAANSGTCTITNGVSTNAVDSVALFTFPAVTIGTVSRDTSCTTSIPSSWTLSTAGGTGSNNWFQVDGTWGGWQNTTNRSGTVTGSTVTAFYDSSFGYFTIPYQMGWTGVPDGTSYTFPTAGASSYSPSGSTSGTYQVTSFLSDYKTAPLSSTLNSSSTLVKAAGAVSNCAGMAPPNFDGALGTYYAGVIYAAQSALTAAKAANSGSQNVLILLSDGDATAPQSWNGYPTMGSAGSNGSYPSYVNECTQSIVAAKAATTAGTRVYTVAYGSESSGCSTDTSGTYAGITPCQAMQDMASAAQYFFSDYNQSGSNSTCYSSAQPVASLAGIFTQIASDLTVSRLIPNSTT
ncbi:Putative Flp pilus-assembly TadE/G-like [Bryocella elongata]|uniref:Putative Flp pilus-assembly TadE/G-like n=1 Tax=Bryocella elongata TaxID=863522 RepID=A0A1H5ZNP8_9BACT|nr:pilus assembly protein TadG-related protein [Bryocella elongata]SEG37822.1 Putative Flp pilus-assembly TadE/G-like [Bryocella elongata]